MGDMIGADEFNSSKTWMMILAEFLGTFFLVLFGCGSIIFANRSEVDIEVALAFGLTLLWLVYCFGPISGCHINPAITLSFLVVQKIPVLRTLCYILVQLVGAVLAIYVLDMITGNRQASEGITYVKHGLSPIQGMTVELIGTFVLTYAVHAAGADRGFGPLIISLTLVGNQMFMTGFTGASMNPARSFGPAAVYQEFTNHWVYWAGPILGGIIGGFVHSVMGAGSGGSGGGGGSDVESA